MESKKEYRDVPAVIKLPKEVYHRCIWLVRDSARLKRLAEAGINEPENTDGTYADAQSEEIPEPITVAGEEVIRRAAYETGCIEEALQKMPEVYREGLLDNIINKTPFSDFAHPNTWKRWKLVFMYELAKELRLI